MCYTLDDLILNHNKNETSNNMNENLDIVFSFVNRLTGKYYNNIQNQLPKYQLTITINKEELNDPHNNNNTN